MFGGPGQDRLYGNDGAALPDGSKDALRGGNAKDTVAGGGGLVAEDSAFGKNILQTKAN